MSELTNKELAKYLKDVRQTSKDAFGADFFDKMLLAAERLAAMPDVYSNPLAYYDAGLLNDSGGGDVGWWHDYIRAELGRAHSFYRFQVDSEKKARVIKDYNAGFDKWREKHCAESDK